MLFLHLQCTHCCLHKYLTFILKTFLASGIVIISWMNMPLSSFTPKLFAARWMDEMLQICWMVPRHLLNIHSFSWTIPQRHLFEGIYTMILVFWLNMSNLYRLISSASLPFTEDIQIHAKIIQKGLSIIYGNSLPVEHISVLVITLQ